MTSQNHSFSQTSSQEMDQNLQSVSQKVEGMAEMVYQELVDCMQAFSDRDKDEASDVVAVDALINANERIIDTHIVKTLISSQPTASNCRQLIAALRITKDLERIGDYATNIANHSATLDQLNLTGEEVNVIEMGEIVKAMMRKCIDAYNTQNIGLASAIRQQDEEVDNQYTQIFANLISISSEKSGLVSACTHLTFIARSLERIGDHITDIAEEILFVVNGEFPEDDRVKADGSSFVRG